ncbi:MAG TPA: 2-dehydropantoate 2-reductase [Vicinamibacterales bacterium]|jgi:2-dehydropantoate 2-reductase|nr:2-dehydropantoate 2-reductase [Vicinamibacterales bacterium]
MNIIVLGAGAIGSLYAAKLSERHEVTVLARQPHAEAINRRGLRLMGLETGVYRVEAVTAIASIPADSLMLLTSKVNDNRTIAAAIAPMVRDDTTIVCVQNGLGGEDVVRETVGNRGLVLRAITQAGAVFREPGVVDYRVAGYTLLEQSARSPEIASLLTACGLDGRVSEDIKVDVWRKLIFNCVINPITSIIGAEVGAIADRRLDPVKRLVIDECLAVARADGVTFDTDFLEAIARVFGPSHNVASMQQDLRRGKATEIDFMNGAVVGLGRRVGIDCPVNAALVAIVKAMEARGRFVVP